jgi:hypothetical protein
LPLQLAGVEIGLSPCRMAGARELAYRMGKAGDELNQAHFDGVVKLLREHLEIIAELELRP